MQIVDGVIRHYDWGSATAIPELLGRPVTGEPAAELWFGAHPTGPALVGADARPLDEVVAADPEGALGPDIARRYGTLPFLMKVLAAARPLSLQAHPSAEQAEAGFEREEAAGIPIDAPNRSFRDRRHKPELICALSPFEALCGFRDPSVTVDLLASLQVRTLDPLLDIVRNDQSPAGLGRALAWLLTLESADAAAMVEPVVDVCGQDLPGPFREERTVVAALGERYPGDSGVITSLLLNLVTLQPGEALFLGAGNLHAYLRGTGIEVMASSDNVVRGGLTSKPVDVATLLEIVDTRPLRPLVQRPTPIDAVATYDSPVPDFTLSRIDLDGALTLAPGPAILLCVEGHVEAAGRVLERGAAAWLPAVDGPLSIEGRATLFRAAAGRSATG